MTPLKYRSAGTSHTGKVRKANEDAVLVMDPRTTYVVADGMGGHENGGWASAQIVDAIAAARSTGQFEDDCQNLSDAIHMANAQIYDAAQKIQAQMGATIVALAFTGDRFAIFWAGDSRAYLLRGGQLFQLTRDHTAVQDMIARGLISEAEAVTHPMRHVLNKAVGVQEDLELDGITDTARPNDCFLLCSDGLTGLVEDDEIREVMATANPEQGVALLLERVLARGAHDNVTIVMVACEEQTQLLFASPVGMAQ